MDETTEPVIAVLGHPIAGNPSQFALERALESLPCDGRVLSLEVAPERLAVALEGADALGLRGVLLDAALSRAARTWAEARAGALGAGALGAGSRAVDCLYRDPARPEHLVGADLARQWLGAAIDRHFQLRGRRIEDVVWIGPAPDRGALPPAERLAGAQLSATERIMADRLAQADVVFLTPGGAAENRTAGRRPGDRWPPDDASTLVVDLTDAGHPAAGRLRQLGYHVLSIEERRVAVLAEGLRLWNGQTVSEDILRDAIEEYLAV